MRGACIDIGSNTTRLLVGELDPSRPGRLREVAVARTFIRLSAAERSAGISAANADALVAAVAEHAASARAAGVQPDAVRVVATAALREAPDRETLAARLSGAAGAPVEILTGAQEAALAFAGATAGLGADDGVVAVVDVGGGSTELAVGVPGEGVRWWASVPIGSGALADAHLTGDPPSPGELAGARAAADAALASAGCEPAASARVVGSSAASVRQLAGGLLDAAALDAALTTVCGRPAAEAALALGLHVERTRLLPAALILLAAVARALRCPLESGRGGLREGVVLDLLRRG